jgi:chromosome segregation ATPase
MVGLICFEMLDAIKQKITQLIAAYEAEKAECNRLRSLLEQAEKQNEAYAKQIIELDRQIDNQRLAGAFLNGDNAESKKKIDRLIKEIDKCITLMEG